MAEDLMVGFKFHEAEDKRGEDTSVLTAEELMIQEMTFRNVTEAPSASKWTDATDLKAVDDFEFSESFDFMM